MSERQPYVIQHVEQCAICKNHLEDEAEQLRQQGMTFQEIAQTLSEKYGLDLSVHAVKRHFRFVARLRLQESFSDSLELDVKYGIERFEQMDLRQRIMYLNLLSGKALVRLTAFFYEIVDPKRFFNIAANQNLYSLAKAYGEISRMHSDTTKFLMELDKVNEDELLQKLIELAAEIGLADAISQPTGGEIDEVTIDREETD